MTPETQSRLLRRTLPLALLVAAVSAAAVKIYRLWPREMTAVVRLRISEGKEAPLVLLQVVERANPERVLSRVMMQTRPGTGGRIEEHHTWKLPPGDYSVSCELSGSIQQREDREINLRESTSLVFDF